ncbi:hypothetical protein RJ639_042073 [Escallonia herrerae]|uniref:GAG-pre-integrase domain-containing protein n=1 Tax=Escallonia herrerae TaxID=1293975 RepID=A0AA89B5X4_9ASTE|nr:hypothetical protein RJ639_042073 [Escallonia herrerae]
MSKQAWGAPLLLESIPKFSSAPSGYSFFELDHLKNSRHQSIAGSKGRNGGDEFFGALPSEFDTAKSQILSSTDITSLQEVFSLVLNTESTSSNQQSNVLVANRGGGVKLAEGIITEETEEVEIEGLIIEERVKLFAIIAKSLDTESVTDLMTKQTIGKGHISDGLYILDTWVPHSVVCSGVVSPFEAHCRLGHPALSVLKKLCPRFHDVSSVDCDSCHFAKHHRSSLSPRVNKQAEFAFELAHSDVWNRVLFSLKLGSDILLLLNGDVPYSVLFPTKALFPVEAPIFGSTCFVRDVRPHLTKLDPKALKCVFLVPIESVILEDRTLEDSLSTPVYVPVEPSIATDGDSSDVKQLEDMDCLGEQAIVPSAPMKPPIVQVHSWRPEHHDTCPAPALSPSDPPPTDLDLPIGLRKGERQCTLPKYSIANFIYYDHLSSSSSSLILSLDSVSIPKTLLPRIDLYNIKNAFLHGDLVKEVYMEQPSGFVTQWEYGKRLKKAGAKPCNTPMNPSVRFTKDDSDHFDDPEKYRRLIGKLNYLTVTRPDIAYAVSIVSQFMSEPIVQHWAALEQILCYLKGAPGLGLLYSNHGHSCIKCFSNTDWAGSKLDRKSIMGYCVFVGGNLVSWKSKKQSFVSWSNAKSGYRAMAQSTCEVMWIYHLLDEISLKPPLPAKLWCDNQAALHIASNLVYHERTKHNEVDCHFIREKILDNLISTSFVKTGEQLGDILTKSLNGTRAEYFCNKLG